MNGKCKRVVPTILAALALSLSASCGWADDRDHDGGRHRLDFRTLQAEWWQWALSIPKVANPILDINGNQCMVGQRGAIWFLAGSGGGSASRSCSIPEGVTLFFPIVNSVNFDTPGICGQTGPLSVAELRQFSANFINSIQAVTATLDSVPVRGVRRVRSEVFPLALPADNYFTAPNCFVPAGVFPRSVDEGYYAAVEPLAVGVHTLHFTASGPPATDPFALNVVYTLTVVAKDRP